MPGGSARCNRGGDCACRARGGLCLQADLRPRNDDLCLFHQRVSDVCAAVGVATSTRKEADMGDRRVVYGGRALFQQVPADVSAMLLALPDGNRTLAAAQRGADQTLTVRSPRDDGQLTAARGLRRRYPLLHGLQWQRPCHDDLISATRSYYVFFMKGDRTALLLVSRCLLSRCRSIVTIPGFCRSPTSIATISTGRIDAQAKPLNHFRSRATGYLVPELGAVIGARKGHVRYGYAEERA